MAKRCPHHDPAHPDRQCVRRQGHTDRYHQSEHPTPPVGVHCNLWRNADAVTVQVPSGPYIDPEDQR